MKHNIIAEKSFDFSVRIYHLHKYLIEAKKEYDVARQILRSGTSMAANVEEAIGGHTEKDFCVKLSIVYKEARETKYWIRFLRATKLINVELAISLLEDCEEIIRISGKIISTIKAKYNINKPS